MEIEELQSDFTNVTNSITGWTHNFLADMGVSEQWIAYVRVLIVLAIIAAVVFILQYAVRNILTFSFHKLSKGNRLNFFEYAINNRLPHFLALVVPYSFVRSSIPLLLVDFKTLISPALKLTDIYMVFMVIWTLMAVIRTGADVIQNKPAFRNKPLKSYLQVIQIIFFIFGAVVIYSILTGKSATGFFAAMGAASAILMLMFKDTIMGFVSSIQLSANDMVQLGDWITMSKYGADGTVEEVNLTTVKVVNFDKTITTIPTYALIADSFQNWRGMQLAGGRRFTRSLYIKQSDIRFVTDEEVEKFKQIKGVKDYIERKEAEFRLLNGSEENKDDIVLNKYRLTNNDLFMQYAMWYLKNHPRINTKLTLLVRQLAPTPQGLPVQLYTFTNTTVWAEYEGILAEIINHLVSSVKYFDLRIYEEPAGSDRFNIHINGKEETIQQLTH